MENSHWTDDELIERLYGVGRDDSHLAACADCRGRLADLEKARKVLLEAPELSPEVLRSQRSRIEERLAAAEPPRRLIPAIAMAVLLVVSIALNRPAPMPSTSSTQPNADARWFEEVFSQVSTAEPQTVAPLHALFQVKRDSKSPEVRQ